MAPEHPTAGFNLGVCYERLGKYEQAIEAFTTAATRNNQLWQAHVGLGYCLLRLGRNGEALQAFRDSLELQPDSDKAVFGMAVALQSLERFDEAEDAYVRLLPAYSENVEMLSNLVGLAASRKDTQAVRECSRHLLELRPNSRVGHEGMLIASLEDADYAAAMTHAEQITAASPRDARAWYNLGLASQKAGDLDKAARAYQEAIRLAPEAVEPHANLGTVLQQTGDLAGAKACYEEALTLRPAPNRLWNLALACEQLGEPEEAELAYEQLVEIRRDWADAWFRLAAIRFERGDIERALNGFEAASSARPDWPEAVVNTGVCLYRLQRSQDAIGVFEKALGMSTGNSYALTGLAASCVAAGEPVRAFDAYSTLASQGVPSPELAFNLGLALQQAGDHERAAQCYRDALKSRPDFVEAHVNLGHALQAMGNGDDARQHWSRAIQIEPKLSATYFN